MSINPDLAADAMRVIAAWAYIETDLAGLTSSVLGAHAVAVSAMLTHVNNSRLRQELIHEAISEVLKEDADNLDLFEQVMRVVSSVSKARHRYAHHIWAIAPERPELLILIEPKDVFQRDAKLVALTRDLFALHEQLESDPRDQEWEKIMDGTPKHVVPKLDRGRMQAYTHDEITSHSREAFRAHILLRALEIVLAPAPIVGDAPDSRDLARRVLSKHLAPQQ